MRKTARQVFLSLQPCLTTSWFQTTINCADLHSTNPFLVSRLCNALIKGFNTAQNMPKLVVVVLENDMINEVKDRKANPNYLHEHYGKYLEELIKTFHKTKDQFAKLVPINGKRPGWPTLVFIKATLHRSYKTKEYEERVKFNKTLEIIAKIHTDVWALPLLQVWDENNLNIFTKEEDRLTSDGLKILWRAIDKTITYSSKKITREDLKFDRELEEQNIKKWENMNEFKADKTYWNRKDPIAGTSTRTNRAHGSPKGHRDNRRDIFWGRDRYRGSNEDLRRKLPKPGTSRRKIEF